MSTYTIQMVNRITFELVLRKYHATSLKSAMQQAAVQCYNSDEVFLLHNVGAGLCEENIIFDVY